MQNMSLIDNITFSVPWALVEDKRYEEDIHVIIRHHNFAVTYYSFYKKVKLFLRLIN
jgi:hypothetical protein